MTNTNLLSRSQWLTLLRTGISTGAWDFVRQAAEAYLAAVPNDLEVRLLQAESLLGMGKHQQAYTLASEVAASDPENTSAHRLRWRALPPDTAIAQRTELAGVLTALGTPPAGAVPPSWGLALQEAYQAMKAHDLEAAQQALFPALPGNDHIALLSVAHLRLVWAQGDWAATLHLARTYYRRWPKALPIRLILAHHLAESGQETESVALLHQAAIDDPAGEVVQRLFGANHPYQALWPAHLAAPMDIPLPAEVAAALGRNRLPGETEETARQKAAPVQATSAGGKKPVRKNELQSKVQPTAATPKAQDANRLHNAQANEGARPTRKQGQTSAINATPKPLRPASSHKTSARRRRKSRREATSSRKKAANTRAVKAALAETARKIKMPHLANADGRFPVYVVLTTRQGLTKRYGTETTHVILEHLERLVQAVENRPDWDALLLLADDPTSTHEHGVKPVPANDPWAIKRQLAALDEALKTKGSMIGALLIVGGHEVVPFHRLPNPIEDADDVVPSDNPYGALDENYFAPAWPVGRLPGSADSDPGLLLGALRRMIADHNKRHERMPWYRRWWLKIQRRVQGLRHRHSSSLGYTAEVWVEVAKSVFREIGSPKALWASPPLQATAVGTLPRARLGYFNLHGLSDAPAWYGQRNPETSPEGAPDYPVALRPEDIANHGQALEVVFTEACYGAYLDGKTPREAISLRFLETGTRVFVGATVTAYGAVEPPLAAADLLGHLFWQRLKAGLPAGEALRQAKYLYAREMHQRQGFLDGEDQKTLISFVLYGDPLYQPFANGVTLAKGEILRPRHSVRVQTSSEHVEGDVTHLPPQVVQQVKALAKAYLPGVNGAQMMVAEERVAIETSPKHKGRKQTRLQRKVVVVSKEVPMASIKHRHFVRVTVDAKGKVLKVSVSR